jgi:branched-chain amino acid transport system permease protein
MGYVYHILVFISIYAILAVSLDLIAGHAGFISVAQAAFYGLGAYISALTTVSLRLPFLVGVLIGMLSGALLSLFISLPSLRLHDDYFVIATFGFQVIIFDILNNWVSVTRGPFGIREVPQPSIFGLPVGSQITFVVLAIAFAAFAYVVVARLIKSPFGRVLHAIREDEVFTKAVGKNTVRFKVTAFALSAALAATAGSLYAHYITYVDPTNFTTAESILVVSMVIIGGAGSPWGSLIGAIMLVMLPEALRFIGMPSSVAANLRQIIYGGLLVFIMLFRPRGILGYYSFGR